MYLICQDDKKAMDIIDRFLKLCEQGSITFYQFQSIVKDLGFISDDQRHKLVEITPFKRFDKPII
jgi:hypothetical protein